MKIINTNHPLSTNLVTPNSLKSTFIKYSKRDILVTHYDKMSHQTINNNHLKQH